MRHAARMASPAQRFPRSAFDSIGPLVYFPRMLDKIRLHAAGELPAEYHAFLGDGFDGRLCRFLRLDYAAVRQRTLAGGTDEEIFAWAKENGRDLTDEDLAIWSKCAVKFGWRDEDNGATGRLEMHKANSGLAHREDIVTFFDFYEVDEKRRP